MYSADDLKIVDALPFLRRNAGMFFRSGAPNTAELLGRVESYLRSGDWGPSKVDQQGGLVVVRSTDDWMETAVPVSDLFEHLHPTPHIGPNTDRPEVFVAAFSRAWGTRGDAGSATGPQDAEIARLLSEARPEWRRVLVWRPL